MDTVHTFNMKFHHKLIHIAFLIVICHQIQSYSPDSTSKLICVPGIKRFSSNDQHYYYQCKQAGDLAVLVKCPNRQFYWPEKERCFDEDDHSTQRLRRNVGSPTNPNEQPRIEERVVLGQIVLGLGDLYDAKHDRFLAGSSLWSTKTINASKRRHNQLSSSISYAAGKTLSEKMDEMKISASIKLDFLGGLISISGGAEFYRSSSSLENEETFNAIYETRSHSEVLPIYTPKDYLQACASKEATHVVSQVLYGQRGYLSFKHKLSTSSETQHVKGSLQALVKSVFTISGQASVDLKGSEKSLSESTESRIYGDFILNTMPTSFIEAIKTFKGLASLNGKSPDKMSVKPVKVQLTPLRKYCDKSTAILIRISSTMIDEVTKVLDEIEKLHIKVNTLLSQKPAVIYQPVRKNLDIYETFLRKYQNQLKGKLQAILPAIRSKRGKSEADLNLLISQYLSSPLKYEASTRFLSRRAREIRAIQYLIDNFDARNQKNVQITDYESANDVDISLRYPSVVIFSVNILQPKEVTESFINGTEVDESSFWFNNLHSVGSLGNQIRLFKEFAAANKDNDKVFYLFKINKKRANPANITAIKGSKYLSFEIPIKPEKPIHLSTQHNAITIKVKLPNNVFVKKFYILYWNIVEGEENAKATSYFDLPKSIVKLENLNSGTFYQYRVVHYTEFGISPSSTAGDPVMTTPSSPPANLQVKEVSEDYVTLTWAEPLYIGKNITLSGYRISIYRNNTLIKITSTSSSVTSVTFTNLMSSKKYIIEAVAVTPTITVSTLRDNITKMLESHQTSLTTFTLPKPPVFLNVVSTALNSIRIAWNQPFIAKEVQLFEFVVKYFEMNNNGSNGIVGTEKRQSALTNLNATISGLTQGTTYGFMVQMKTSSGATKLSGILTGRTDYNFTELDKLKNSMSNEVMEKVNHMRKFIMNAANNSSVSHVKAMKHSIMNDVNHQFKTSYSTLGLLHFGLQYGDVLQKRGDDNYFTFTSINIPHLNDLFQTVSPNSKAIRIYNDGEVYIGGGRRSRLPSNNNATIVAGYVSDFKIYDTSGSVYIRSQVHANARNLLNNHINKFLFLNGQQTTFSSRFLLLVTYNNTALYKDRNSRYTFQIALASDGVQSFAIYLYERLDQNAQYGVGYYVPKCGMKNLIDNTRSKELQWTSNIKREGIHVMPLKC